MRLARVQKPRFQQKRAVMSLDDAEMALNLIDLAQTTQVSEPHCMSPEQVMSPDFLTELYSAASMIMDRDECEALQKELAQIRTPYSVAA